MREIFKCAAQVQRIFFHFAYHTVILYASCVRFRNRQFLYSTDQMQGISLARLSLATNAFIAGNERVYRWQRMHLSLKANAFSN